MNLRNLVVNAFLVLAAELAFIQPVSAGSFTPIRVNAGGPVYTDSLGQTWSADTDYSGGNVHTTTSHIRGTPDPTLYQTWRYGQFSYQFAVPNGGYNVVLKFAETYWYFVGQRIFSVSINGVPVLKNFDIVAAAGKPLTAIDRAFTVKVTSGTLTIKFIKGSADVPKVNAISVAPLSSASTAHGQLSLSPTSFAFGNVDIGTTASQTFTVSNTGTAAITLSHVSVSGAGFNATGVSSGVILNPGQSTTGTATFAPATAGALTGGVLFTSNAANASATIALSGTGVQPSAATHSVLLKWDPTSSAVVGYYVHRGTASGGPFTTLNASPVSTTTYTDTTIQSGHVYYYAVTSVDSSQVQSAYSNEVSVTVP